LAFQSLSEILADCRAGHWAVPAFDVINHETALAVLEGALAERAPVILLLHPVQTSMKHWLGLVAFIRAEAESAPVPVCLQLDHGTTIDQVRAALQLRFSAVMIDGSTLPLDQNIALTRTVVLEAHARGVSVEAELGHVGKAGESPQRGETASHLTQVDQARRFVAESQADALAVSIGTVHGLYQAEPKLDFDRLEKLREVVEVPLVLHGGSYTPDADVRRTIAGGICKVNIWTEVALAFVATLKEQLAPPVQQCRLTEALVRAQRSAQEVVQKKIRLLGASGRAR
jgi:fructose-bisphosphate aldolase, class II